MTLKPLRQRGPRTTGVSRRKPRKPDTGRAERPRWRQAPLVLQEDLEKQAWPKEKPYPDFYNGAQKGTLPERRVLWWLLYRGKVERHNFQFQTDFLGGRLGIGGGVADFAIYNQMAGGILVWEVMGEEWHILPWHQKRDAARKMHILSTKFNGWPVVAYVELWERDINYSNARRDQICEAGLKGVQLGGPVAL